MAGQREDKYVNVATLRIDQTVINTLTFEELTMGIAIFEKKAILIQRIEYDFFAGGVQELVGAADRLSAGIAISDQIDALTLADSLVIDKVAWFINTYGVAANAELITQPIIRDFSYLKGGGLLLPSRPIYGVVNSGGFVAVTGVYIKFYFTIVDLKPEDYWELVESRRIIV